MCGICGIYGFSDEKLVRKMCKLLEHRGPDEHGFFHDKNIGLGSRRLSIIDIAGGKQPIHNENHDIWIVFNGEIYNYLDLRRDLEKNGHVFYTKTDTEVIIHLYEEIGYDFVKKLRGVFSFAIWDSKKKRLILARDRIGITPLYYMKMGNKLLFSSEIKSLLEYDDFEKKINTDAIHYYLTFQYIPSPLTAFSGINKLKPGHMIVLENDQLKISKYWELNNEKTNFTEKKYSKILMDLLKESVKIRLMSEVPLGIYLSGGLDSSTVTAIASRMIDEPIKTFSIGNNFDESDELKYAKIVSEEFSTNHSEVIINSNDIIKSIFKIFWHLDEPIADSAAVPEFFLSKEAKKKVTVILSGGGSDELFGGYSNYKNIIFFDNIRRFFPHSLRKLTPFLASKFSKKSSVLDYAKYISTNEEKPLQYKTQGYLFYYDKEDLYNDKFNKITENKDPKDIVKEYYYSNIFTKYPKDVFDRLSFVDLKMFVPDNCLSHQEKTGYANSVEIRAPFLDHKMVEFAFSIPSKFKLTRTDFKYILKRTMKNELPKSIITRKKMGFPAPTNHWFSERDLKNFSIDIIENSGIINDYFNKKFVNNLFSKSGLTKNGHQLWGILALSVWYKIFFENYKVKI